MDITICKSFIENSHYNRNTAVLFSFAGQNNNRVVINNKILEIYKGIDISIIKEWILLMDAVGFWKKIDVEETCIENIFPNTCKASKHKILFVSDYEEYDDNLCLDISVLNSLDAEHLLSSRNQTINVLGERAQVTTGDGSDINSRSLL
ncbi:hypothetical protein [Arcobacter defluvii]|uniref:Uncharacterized protein n=1 Tax=Arcobacter defluvii TaxID=873191 RepID=A0AAE7BB88_9BACT|nr:hypothetical protein [Arcobacter defluvii]QKF76136.1 hypothetical protein ADFLV_0064 [Arcobacter defluvii]RXI32292.1 hypothetical protein CP964_08440 [Arcobacter defluvii]